VLEELRSGGYTLGGEQSGTSCCPRTPPPGDGVLTALRLMARVVGSGSTLAELSGVMRRCRRSWSTSGVTDKAAVAVAGSVADAVADVQRELGGRGACYWVVRDRATRSGDGGGAGRTILAQAAASRLGHRGGVVR